MNKKTWKRVSALAIVILWGMLLITTLIVSLINNEFCRQLFPGLIFIDVVLPIVAYAIMLVYRILSKRKSD